MIAWAYRATQRQMLYGIPAPVLTETLTGERADARIHRVIPANDVVLDTTAEIARRAGTLRHRSGRSDLTIDAIVVATAANHPGSIVMTSDPDDLKMLASLLPPAHLAIRSVNEGPPAASRSKRK